MSDRDEFLAWAVALFRSYGWKVHAQPEHRPEFPDMVAVKRGWLVFLGIPAPQWASLSAATNRIDQWTGSADDLDGRRAQLEAWARNG